MKKSLFISRLLRALLAFAVFSQVQAKDITLTDSDYLVDPNEGYWYWKYWDTQTQLYYLAYDFHVKTDKALVRNAGLSGPVYIYSGAKLTLAAADDDGNKAGELLQNTGNSSDSKIWKMLYEWGSSYRLSINMKDNSALDYRDQELYLGVLTIDKGAHVEITAGTFAARAIGNWDNDFTITANTSIQNSSGGAPTLWLGNGYTKSLTLERSLNVNLTVARDLDRYSTYIDSTGKFHMPEGVYNPLGGGGGDPDFNKTRLDGGAILLPAFSDNTIEGYLRGTTKIYLGNKTRLNGLERSRGDGGTDISWLLNDIVVQRGCEAEMNKGYYGGTVTMDAYSSLKFDVIPIPAGVDDKQWAGGAKVVMTGDNTLNLAGRTTNVTLDAAAGRWNTVTNGVFTGTATVGTGGSLKLDCALDGNPVMNMKSDAKLFMPERELHFGSLTINAEGKITFALKPGAPINGNVNIKYTGIDMGTAPVAEIVYWTSNGNTFTLAGMHGMFINSTVNGNTRIDTDTAVNFNGLVIKDALLVNYTKETLSTYAGWDVDMGEEVTGNLTVNALNGRVKVGSLYGTGTVNALDIQVDSFTGDRLELRSNRSVTLAGDIDASDKLVVSDLNSGKANVFIQASITAANAISLSGTSITGGNDNEIYSAPSYKINAQEEIDLGGTFLGGDLTVTAGKGISLGAVGISGESVHSANITSTSGPIAVNSFNGGSTGTMQLSARDQIILGKEVPIGQQMPVFRGNVIVDYTGDDHVQDRSDVVMNGIMRGNLTVNANGGRVSAASIEGSGSIAAKNIYLLSFSGSALVLKASNNMTLKGTVEATDTLQCDGLDNKYANITFSSSLTATNRILLNGNKISGDSAGFLSSERYDINARDTVAIKQTFQGGDITIGAVGDVSLGTVGISGNSVDSANISSTTGSITMGDFTGYSLVASAANGISIKSASIAGSRESSITSGTEVAFKGEANLQNTKVKAPQVSLEGALALTRQSLIEGNVIAAAKYGVTVEDSTITGTVGGAKELNLVNASLGGAVGFTSLDLKGASQINADLTLAQSTVLSFFLDADINSTTPVLTLNGKLCQNSKDPVESLIISLDGNGNLETGERYALISHRGQAPDFWNEECVTVIGMEASTDDLFWQDGTLYFRCTKPVLQTATWTGGVSGIWGGTDRNWVQGDYEYSYKDGVEVEFGDEGSGIVLLKGDLAPTNVLVDNSEGHDYLFMGDGRLVGPTALVKEGNGSLTLFNDNAHTGGTIIREGSVVLGGSAHSLGEGAVVLEGGCSISAATASPMMCT